MVAARCALGQIGIGLAILIGSVLGESFARGQSQQDIDRCAGKGGVVAEVQIRSCTALIESKAYSGKDLALPGAADRLLRSVLPQQDVPRRLIRSDLGNHLSNDGAAE
jgi:hypothetical protein